MAVSPQALGAKCNRERVGVTASSWKLRNDLVSLTGRYGHSLTLVNNRIFLFGGYSDIYHGELYVYNDNGKWICLNNHVTSPRPRFGHSAFEYDGSLYIFGGDSGYRCLNDVWKFNLFERTWVLLETTGQIPEGRSCMGSVVYKDKLIIFGGVDRYFVDGCRYFNDVYIMDLKTNHWSRIQTQKFEECLKQREAEISEDSSSSSSSSSSRSSSSRHNSLSSSLTKNNLETTEVSSNKSTVIVKGNFDGSYKLTSEDLYIEEKSEEFPRPRKGHVMFLVGNKVYIFAGIDKNNQMLNDLWSLDLETFSWKCLRKTENGTVSDDLLLPRAYSAFCSSNGHFFLFGGISEKDYLNDLWVFDKELETFVLCSNSVFNDCGRGNNASRQSTRSERISESRQKPRDTSKRTDPDFYYRPTTAKTQEMIQTNKISPIGRQGAAMVIKFDKIVLFGGYSYLGLMNDTWEVILSNLEEYKSRDNVEDFAQVPLTEDDANFDLILSGFKKFMNDKVKALTEIYNNKNGKVKVAVDEFKNDLNKLIVDLDNSDEKIKTSVEKTDSVMKELYDEFVKFAEDHKSIIDETEQLNGSLKGEFGELKVIAKETLNNLREFGEVINKVFNKYSEKNNKMEEELEKRFSNVSGWISSHSNDLNERISSFDERCKRYDEEISKATSRVEEMNDHQMTFFTDAAHKINDFKNDIEDYRNSIINDFSHMVERNEEVITDLDKQMDNMKNQLDEKRNQNFEAIGEIDDIVNNCMTHIDVKFNDADNLNKEDEEAVNAKIKEYEDAINNALNENKDKNERYVMKTIKKVTYRCDKHMEDLGDIKNKVQNRNSEVESAQKKFTESIMSDIDTIHANEIESIGNKCKSINASIDSLQLNVSNIDQQVKDESVQKINKDQEDILKYCKEKIKKIFKKCEDSNTEYLNKEEEELLKLMNDLEEKVNHRNDKYSEFLEEIQRVKKMIEELKEGHYDSFNNYGENIDNLKNGIEETINILTACVERDKRKELKYRDKQDKMEARFNKCTSKINKISKTIEKLDEVTNESIESINRSKDTLGGAVESQKKRLDGIEEKINDEISGGISKYENLTAKVEDLQNKEKQNKAELISHGNDVTNKIEMSNKKVGDSIDNFKEIQKKINDKLSNITMKVLETASTCKAIDIPDERFVHAESSIQVVKDQNQVVKEKVDAVNKKVEDFESQLDDGTKERKDDFVNKFNEKQEAINNIIKEHVYGPIEKNKEQCAERVDKAIENLDKCDKIISEKENQLINDHREIKDKSEEMRKNIEFNQKVINDRRAQMGLSIDKVNKAIKEKRDSEHEALKKYQEYLSKYDNKNRIDCEDIILAYDKMSEDMIRSSQECYQQYLNTISGLDLEFISHLPEQIKALEIDAADLDAAVNEVRKQVRAHATELTNIKASLRDIACISEKAYESSSKLIGRVKPVDQTANE